MFMSTSRRLEKFTSGVSGVVNFLEKDNGDIIGFDIMTANFLHKAKETYKVHRSKLLSDETWTISQTAKFLHRSMGSVCEDLLICKWYKTNPDDMDKFDYAYEAINWIRVMERKQELDEID